MSSVCGCSVGLLHQWFWSRQQTPKVVMTTEQMMIIAARLKTSHSSSYSQFHFPPLSSLSFFSPSIPAPNKSVDLCGKCEEETLQGCLAIYITWVRFRKIIMFWLKLLDFVATNIWKSLKNIRFCWRKRGWKMSRHLV